MNNQPNQPLLISLFLCLFLVGFSAFSKEYQFFAFFTLLSIILSIVLFIENLTSQPKP